MLMIFLADISPLSFSPVGEKLVTLNVDNTLIIRQQEYLSLPFGGGWVGADVIYP